jgi:hypothetical protein
MNRFFINIILFILLLAGFSVYSFFIVEKYYHSGSGYEQVNLSYHHYILGDSHSYKLKDFTENAGIYNFSFGSDSYYDMYRKLNYLIDNTRLETVFITVNDQSLSVYRERQNNLDRSIFYTTQKEYDNLYEYLKVKYISRYITLFNPKVRSLVRS